MTAVKAWRVALALVLAFAHPAAGAEAVVDSRLTARLISQASRRVDDPSAWALDLHDVLQAQGLPESRENICAAIAVIAQESGFVADPAVPGLGKLSEKALREKLERIPIGGALALQWLESNPSPSASFMDRVRNAKTERDLDLAYRALVEKAGKSTSTEVVMRLGLLNTLIEDRNEIDTAGSMQVSVKFALDDTRKERWLPMSLEDVYAVRDQLYTRRGGMYYGVKQLLGYDTGYSQKVFRFADYNAGRYAARNAAFQTAAADLSGKSIAIDGDLLRYGKDGNPKKDVTETERAIRAASERHGLGLDASAIRADLRQEKQLGFTGTRTFIAIRDQFAKVRKRQAPFAVVPDIALHSPKLAKGFTTRRFAESVNRRYQACMAAK